MTLYELDKEILSFYDKFERTSDGIVDTETGEVLNEADIAIRLQGLEMEKEKKLDNIALYCKNLRAESEAIGAEIKKLTERKKAKDNRLDSLKWLLKTSLGGSKRERAEYSVSFRKTESVRVNVEPELLPKEYQKVAITADKMGIKNAIKNGFDVKGAELVQDLSVTIK